MLDTLRSEILALEAAMRPLEPGGDERSRLGQMTLEHALAYLDAIPEAPANNSWSDVFARRLEPEFADAGRDAADILDYLGQCHRAGTKSCAGPGRRCRRDRCR